ncbi:hypothetical protein MPH_01161 [Macrophomina phaseolina MS6]|uniref:Uncharacterized protein n=1 Tax=Macrophomina phaseolina (strain MS6) TaxID=1126212 RepID=K2S3J7_MACPH|nr:hypothetical protein MPH_01161 [Macrophomina phaseolina MS6]
MIPKPIPRRNRLSRVEHGFPEALKPGLHLYSGNYYIEIIRLRHPTNLAVKFGPNDSLMPECLALSKLTTGVHVRYVCTGGGTPGAPIQPHRRGDAQAGGVDPVVQDVCIVEYDGLALSALAVCHGAYQSGRGVYGQPRDGLLRRHQARLEQRGPRDEGVGTG